MYDNITLEKGLYNISGKSFTEALRELDADENYIGTELEGLDAYERQLKRFDIKVSGPDSDRVEKFIKTTQSAILFPEFVRRCIKAGMDGASILPEIVAATTYTDGVDYRGLAITDNGSDEAIAAGADLPITSVKNAASTVAVSKYGRQIQTVYEVLKKQRLDLFGVVLKATGAKISGVINKAAAEVLANGVDKTPLAGDTLTYADLAAFWASMEGHSMSAMLVSPKVMATILAMDEMRYASGRISGGTVETPYGVKLVKCSGLSDEYAIGVDASSALEMVLGSDVVVDSDRLISSQTDSIAFSISVGFTKIYSSAVSVLSTVKNG